MKSRLLIFTLFLAVICIGSAGNAMAQSVTGTGVFNPSAGGAPLTVTVSSNGGSGGVLRIGQGQTQVVGQPVDQCVQSDSVFGNAAFVVARITQASGDLAGAEGQFLILGFVDNGKDGDFVLVPFFGTFISTEQIPACDLFTFPFSIPLPVERGGFQGKSS